MKGGMKDLFFTSTIPLYRILIAGNARKGKNRGIKWGFLNLHPDSTIVEFKFEKLADQQPSMSEIIELTKLEDLFEKMQRKRIYSKEKQILEYALQARTLVQTAGRD